MRSPTCLITGPNRGLGRYLASYFWRQGWNLLLVGRQIQQLDELVQSLHQRIGQVAYCIVADFSQPSVATGVIKEARSRVQKLDLLVNNAAIQGCIGPAWENNWEQWRETIQIDMLAPVALCKEVAGWMVEAGSGSIVNLSGGGSTSPRANFSAYATAKAGLVRFSETLAEELRPHRVRVNCIAPGAMSTTMLAEIVAKGKAVAGRREFEIAEKTMRDGGASMERVAELCHFLATDASRRITGKLISAVWDDWEQWPAHADKLASSDAYTLRRITGRDRGFDWGDK